MTADETKQILNVLFINYPQSFKGWKKEQYEMYRDLWIEAFKADDSRIVSGAVKAIIYTEPREFAPNIAQVKNKMVELTGANTTELEAWGIVKKAISRSGWYSNEEFEKLPDDIKRLVGSASQLKSWSQMDSQTVDSVIASNFQRSYKQNAKRNSTIQMLPDDVKKALQIGSDSIIKRIE